MSRLSTKISLGTISSTLLYTTVYTTVENRWQRDQVLFYILATSVFIKKFSSCFIRNTKKLATYVFKFIDKSISISYICVKFEMCLDVLILERISICCEFNVDWWASACYQIPVRKWKKITIVILRLWIQAMACLVTVTFHSLINCQFFCRYNDWFQGMFYNANLSICICKLRHQQIDIYT